VACIDDQLLIVVLPQHCQAVLGCHIGMMIDVICDMAGIAFDICSYLTEQCCCCHQEAENDKILVENVAPAWAALIEAICNLWSIMSAPPRDVYRYYTAPVMCGTLV